MADPVAVRTLVAHFVTETYQAARKRERARALKDEEELKGVVEASPVHILRASQTSISRRQRSDSADPALPLNAATATAGVVDTEVQIRRMEPSRTVTLHPGSELRSPSTCKEVQNNCIRTEEVKEEVVLHDSIEMCTAAKIACRGDELRGSKLERDRKELGILKKDINPFGDRDSDSDE